MSSTLSIACGLPFYPSQQRDQAYTSKVIRVAAVALGIIAIAVGISGLLSVIRLGAVYSWTICSLGMATALVGTVLKCVQKPLFQVRREAIEDPAKIKPGAVYEISQGRSQEIINIAASWIDLLRDKYSRSNNGLKLNQFSLAFPLDKNEMLLNSYSMIRSIWAQLQLPISGVDDRWDSILVCQDEQGKIQAIALFEKANNKLAFLATHPDNLRHPTNSEIATPFRGAGTHIMLALMRLALGNRKPILLRSTTSARPFYERLHFERDPDQISDPKSGFIPMKLTAERIRELINSGVTPFNQIE